MSEILIVENKDPFAFNLKRCIEELGYEAYVQSIEDIDFDAVPKPRAIILSSGSRLPETVKRFEELILHFCLSTPILGIGLGYQCIATVFGGVLIDAPLPMYGKISRIYHEEIGMFRDLPNPMQVMCYHSLVLRMDDIPSCFTIVSFGYSRNGVTGIAHKTLPVVGLQFHPEAYLTEKGHDLIRHFLIGRYQEERTT